MARSSGFLTRAPHMTVSRHLLFCVILPLGALLYSCGGDPSDRPQDCSANEFFDEARELCQSCPVLIVPACREGCAVLVSSDELGCPVASCDLECSSCPDGTSFSLETLSCECPGGASLSSSMVCECPEGQALHPLLGVCSSCPSDDASLPTDCASQGCDCELISSFDDMGCPISSCGMCSNPQDGFLVDEMGMCVSSTM